METKTTDELIKIIIEEVGLPLPLYDYANRRKYITVYPQNITTANGVTGVEAMDAHDTFRSACIALIEWDKKVNGKSHNSEEQV